MRIVYHPGYMDHFEPEGGHPESPRRLEAALASLDAAGVPERLLPAPARMDDVLRAHSESYIQYISTLGPGRLDNDTYLNDKSFEIAMLAAGGALEAAKLAEAGDDAFALVRPPGHHAGRGFGGGFCLVNNVAVAAAAQRARGRKVAIIDIDGHHGNGTEDIFREDAGTLYMSTHHFGIFPGTGLWSDCGEGEAKGTKVNVPLPEGSGDATYGMVWERLWEPVLEQFRPDIVMLSLGFDSHYHDSLTGLVLSSQGMLGLFDRIIAASRRLTKGGTAIILEGGYNEQIIAEIVGAIASGRREGLRYTQNFDERCAGARLVDKAIAHQAHYWVLDHRAF